jgi:hypothetical protein
MAAQFNDVHLPEPHLQDLVFELPTGMYRCEIVQLEDPDDGQHGVPDFALTLTADPAVEPWREPAWHEG